MVKVEGLVSGRSAILIERIDHIGGHMQLAAADVPGLTLLAAVHRRHPGIAGAFCIHPAGVLLRTLQSARAVFTQAFGGSRIILQEERQHDENSNYVGQGTVPCPTTKTVIKSHHQGARIIPLICPYIYQVNN